MTIDPIPIGDYTVLETSDFPSANPDGTISIPDGTERTLLEYEPATDERRVLIHALGASDALDVQYRVFYGQDISFTMESPPGTITEPYSYTLNLGGPLVTNDTFQLTAVNSSGGSIDLAARSHIEVV